jgi:serine/threonine-protein kinase HipA
MAAVPIHLADEHVAEVDSDSGELRYVPQWVQNDESFPISLSMPLAADPYAADFVIPWLTNLLPEGDPLRALAQMIGVSSEDVIGLLEAAGGDVAGALSIGEREPTGDPGYHWLEDEHQLETIINELPRRPFLADEEGVSMSLAGAQNKLPVHAEGERLAIPVNGAPSTHILKPDNPRLPGSVQNEALCMVLAARAGLPVAEVTTGVAGERQFLLVTRYDRSGPDGAVRRIHQEDFCQALGRFPAAKYEFNGTGRRGPSLAEMFELCRDHMTARDINQLLDAIIFNVAVGNVDAHAKNFSILLEPRRVRLAPLYDLMSGLAWEGITHNNAQAIGGQRRSRYVYGRHWRRLAEAAGLSPRATVKRVEQVVAKVLDQLDAAAQMVAEKPAGQGIMLNVFVDQIRGLATEVRSHALIEGDPGADIAEPGDIGAQLDQVSGQ